MTSRLPRTLRPRGVTSLAALGLLLVAGLAHSAPVTGQDLLNDPAVTFPSRTPSTSGTSLVFGPSATAFDVLFRKPLVAAGSIANTDAPTVVTFTVDLTRVANGTNPADHDPHFLVTDGTTAIGFFAGDHGATGAGTGNRRGIDGLDGGNVVTGINYTPAPHRTYTIPAVGQSFQLTANVCLSETGTSVQFPDVGPPFEYGLALDRSAGLSFLFAGNDGYEEYQLNSLDVSVNTGPISRYPLDTDALDAVGSNDPSAVNGVTFVPGKVGNGALFTTGSFIDIPHSASLANQQLTLEAWVRADGAGPNNDSYGSIILQKGFNPPLGNTTASLSLYWSPATERFRFLFGSVLISTDGIESTNTFPSGSFHHVAATYDGATFRLYVDGVLEGQQALVKSISYEAAVPWTIGSAGPAYRGGGFPRTFNGVIDEVNIWPCALSQAQIQSHVDVVGTLTYDLCADVGDEGGTFAGTVVWDSSVAAPTLSNADSFSFSYTPGGSSAVRAFTLTDSADVAEDTLTFTGSLGDPVLTPQVPGSGFVRWAVQSIPSFEGTFFELKADASGEVRWRVFEDEVGPGGSSDQSTSGWTLKLRCENLVQNGSFESQTFTACFDDSQGIYCYSGVSLASGFFAPWTNGTSLFYALRSRPPYWVAQEGNQYVEVDSYAQVYQQTLATVPGQTYTLSFWYAPSAANNDDALRVLWDGAQVDVVDDAPTEASLLDWRKQSYTVTASGTSTVLRFEDAVNTAIYVGGYLDNVSVRSCTGSPSDSTPPAITITAPADGLVTNLGAVTLDADVVDDGATTVTSTPTGVAPGTLPAGGGTVSGSVALAVEGLNVLSVSATDAATNTAGTSIEVYRDTVAPVMTVSPAEGAVVGLAALDLAITVTDQTLTGVTVDAVNAGSATVAGGGVYGVSSLNLPAYGVTLLTEGANAIVVEATDAAGNITTITRNVILDLTAPVVGITDPMNGACFGAGSMNPIPLSATIDDATATDVTGDLTGSLPAGGETVTGTFALSEGSNTISVTATNPGLGLSATDSVTVTLDTILPTVDITTPDEGDCVSGTIEFHADATDAGTVASTTFFVDGGAILPTQTGPDLYEVDTTTLTDGLHTLRVDATDACGNVGTMSISIVVDNTPPEVTITDPVDLAWVSGTIGFDANASDAGSGLASITMTAADLPPTTDELQVYATPVSSDAVSSLVDTLAATAGVDGDLELEVTARDCAGNETTAAITVQVDNTDPAKAITAPADGSKVRCLLDITAEVNEANLASVQISVDGVLSPPLTAPYAVSFDTRDRLDGDMEITLIATDLAGNVSTCSINVTVDNLRVKIRPKTLQLKSRGGNKSMKATIEGQSAALLLGLDPADITLCIPGGSPIPATSFHGHEHGWRCENEHGSGHRGRRKGHRHGHHGHESKVHVKFDRQLVIGALRAAGITNGKVEMTVKATLGGVTYLLGSQRIRVRSRGN